MKNFILKKALILICFVLTAPVFGGDEAHENVVHAAAHFGTSFAINQFFYAANQRVLRMDKPHALGFAIFTTLVVGFTYKYLEVMSQPPGSNVGPDIVRALVWNSAGVLGSCVVIELGNW